MIVSRSSHWPRKQFLLLLVDALLTAAAVVLSVILRLGPVEAGTYLYLHFSGVLTAWAIYLTAFYVCGLYETEGLLQLGRMLASAVVSVFFGSLLITAAFYAMLSVELGRGVFIGFATFVFAAVVSNRLIYITANRHKFLAQRCLIIGTNGEAAKTINLIHHHPQAGIRILGMIHCSPSRDKVGQFMEGYPVLGTLDSLEKFVDIYDIERLILATTIDEEPILLKRLRAFRYRGLAIVDFVTLYEELAQEIPLDHINDEWLFLASLSNSRFHIRRLKRLTDIIVSLLGLILSAPLTVLAVVLIKLTSKGPILYRQERLGRDSSPFTLLKLRTMIADAEGQTGPVWAAENDPRITVIGKWLRKTRIDEIPQLVNVLRGEMSLVGPRPEREVFIHKLSEKIPFYAERLLVNPGVTGWAQVMAPYASSIEDSRKKLQYDLYYIKHMSFFLDTFIFLKTFKTVLFGRERKKKNLILPSKPQIATIKTETLYMHSSHAEIEPAPKAKEHSA